MSETVFSKSGLKEKITRIEISEQFACSLCDNVFDSEVLCDNHIAQCGPYSDTDNDPLSCSNDNGHEGVPKTKSLDPLNCDIMKNESCLSIDSSDNLENKRMKTNIDLNVGLSDVMLEDPVYCVTSKMLSENEMLITLPYDGGLSKPVNQEHLAFVEDMDYENAGNETSNYEIEYRHHSYEESTENTIPGDENTEVVVENTQHDISDHTESSSCLKILAVLSSSNLNKQNADPTSENSIFIEKMHSDDDSVKTLTILNPVKIKDHLPVSDYIERESVDNFIAEKETQCKEDNLKIDSDRQLENNRGKQKNSVALKSSRSKKSLASIARGQIYRKIWDSKFRLEPNTNKIKSTQNTKRRAKQNKTEIKSTKTVTIDLEKLATPIKEKLKQNAVIQTYKHHKKKGSTVKIDHNQKLYQKIPLASSKQKEAEEEPSKFSVFDFFDEEDEKRKIEEKKNEEKLQAVRERTCPYCKETFSDPMDVLRHKRKFHTHRKILLTKEEIEPYLHLPRRTDCPLCFKEICPHGYNSLYTKHLMTHCKDSGFVCGVCGIKFKRRDHLQSHESRHVVPPEKAK